MRLKRIAGGCVLFVVLLAGCKRDEAEEQASVARDRYKDYVLDQAPKRLRGNKLVFDGKVRLLGYTREPRGALRRGKPVKLALYWQALEKVEPGWRLSTQVVDPAGERLVDLDEVGALRELQDGRPALPPEAWEPGKIYQDELSFVMPRNAPADKVRLVAGLVRGDTKMPLTSGREYDSGLGILAWIEVHTPGARRQKQDIVPSLRTDRLDAVTKISVDGKLDEEAWKKAAVVEFVDASTGEPNQSFPVNGSARLLWNKNGFYAGFDVKDPDVVGGFPKEGKDPHLWTKDTVEIMVDPDGDGDNVDYYELQIGPQNLVFDSQFDEYNVPVTEPDGPFGHQEWSSGVKSAVTIDGTLDKSDDQDKGYVVEAFVPWKSFTKAKRSPPSVGDVWRLNFYAMQNNDGVAWSPLLKEGNFHKASRFGRVIWAEAGWTAEGPDPKQDPKASPTPASSAEKKKKPATTPSASAAPTPAKAAPAPGTSAGK